MASTRKIVANWQFSPTVPLIRSPQQENRVLQVTREATSPQLSEAGNDAGGAPGSTCGLEASPNAGNMTLNHVRSEQEYNATFACNRCTREFTRAYGLRSHLRTQIDPCPFICIVCSLAFARQHDRKRHEGLHPSSEFKHDYRETAAQRAFKDREDNESTPRLQALRDDEPATILEPANAAVAYSEHADRGQVDDHTDNTHQKGEAQPSQVVAPIPGVHLAPKPRLRGPAPRIAGPRASRMGHMTNKNDPTPLVYKRKHSQKTPSNAAVVLTPPRTDTALQVMDPGNFEALLTSQQKTTTLASHNVAIELLKKWTVIDISRTGGLIGSI